MQIETASGVVLWLLFQVTCLSGLVRSVQGLSAEELAKRESRFGNKFFNHNISAHFRIAGVQLGPATQDGHWLFDNDTNFFSLKSKGTGVFAPNQISFHLQRKFGNGSCTSRGAGVLTEITHLNTTGFPSSATQQRLVLNFSQTPDGVANIGRVHFFNHINVDDLSKHWKVTGSAGDQRTYSRGASAVLRWENGSIALSLKNVMWKDVIRYPAPPNNPISPLFKHSAYLEGDVDESTSDATLRSVFDPDGLGTFFARIQYITSGTHTCYQSRDVELSFYAVTKPFRVIQPSEQWEKILGLIFGICYSVLAVALLLALILCQLAFSKFCNHSDSEHETETFAGTRRAFHGILLVAGLGQLLIDDTDSIRSLYIQLSWMLFRSTSSQYGSVSGGAVSGRQSLIDTIGGVSPLTPPINSEELTRIVVFCSLLLIVPFLILGVVQLGPLKYRSMPMHWVLILGDWSMFVALLSAFQMIIFRTTVSLNSSMSSSDYAKVTLLLILAVPVFLGFNVAVFFRAVQLRSRNRLTYCTHGTQSRPFVEQIRTGLVHKTCGFYQATPCCQTFHKSYHPVYACFKGKTMFFAVVDPLLLGVHAILLGAIRMSTLVASISVLIPSALKFILYLLFLPRRHLAINYFIIFIAFIETVVHALGLASEFSVTVRWYHIGNTLLLALLIPFLMAFVWYSDWGITWDNVRNGMRQLRIDNLVSKSNDVKHPEGAHDDMTTHNAAGHL